MLGELARRVVTCQTGDVTTALLADHLALDFVGTVAERNTTRLEHLTDPAELGAWLVAAGVVDDAPRADASDLTDAVRLREALYALLRTATAETPEDLRQGAALEREALAVVNNAAAGPSVTVTLTSDGAILRTGDVAAALAHIARTGVELIGGPDRGRVRWCADATCTHPFLDRSRAGRRRWCGMAGCGDRAKARAYRARRREPQG